MRLSNIAIGAIVALCGQTYGQRPVLPKEPSTLGKANTDLLVTPAAKSKQPLTLESPTGEENQTWVFPEDADNGVYIQNGDSGKYLYCPSPESNCTLSRQTQTFQPRHLGGGWAFGEIRSQTVLSYTDENTLKLVQNPSDIKGTAVFSVQPAE